MAKADLSADEARTFISYDQATGAFHWAADLGARAKAGSRAGSKERQGYIAITIRGETYKARRLAGPPAHAALLPSSARTAGAAAASRG